MKVKFLMIIAAVFTLLFVSCDNSSTASSTSKKKNPFEDESDRIIKVGPLEVNEAKMFIS